MGFGNKFIDEMRVRSGDQTTSSTLWDRAWIYGGSTAVYDFKIYGHRCAIDVNVVDYEHLQYSVVGRSDDCQRILRNALIGRFPMVKSNGERHILQSVALESISPDAAVATVENFILEVSKIGRRTVEAMTRGNDLPPGCTNLFWWDTRPNFGDVIGPWLASRITGHQPVNGRGSFLTVPPVAMVGSILSLLEQDGTTVWGSGLMSPLNSESIERLSSLTGINVFAVRGKLTREDLTLKLGWNVPEVYGDPALLLPRFLPKREESVSNGKTVIVPHFMHARYFNNSNSNAVHVVDVEQGMEEVVQEIAGADACISTSLHGVIIAQAYGVPWTWLRISDHPLGGGTFKFDDFFSTLDRGQVRALGVTKDELARVDWASVAAASTLPDLLISLDKLLDSFPLNAPSAGIESKRHTVPPIFADAGLDRAAYEVLSEEQGEEIEVEGLLATVLNELNSHRQILEFLADRHDDGTRSAGGQPPERRAS